MKKYITWKPKKINDYLYEHPNTNDRVQTETSWAIIFTETSFQIDDGRYISLVEHADDMPQSEIDHWRELDTAYEFTIIDETTANTLISELWDVTVSNFIFTDNRPVDDV
jgi:hypothetical protein